MLRAGSDWPNNAAHKHCMEVPSREDKIGAIAIRCSLQTAVPLASVLGFQTSFQGLGHDSADFFAQRGDAFLGHALGLDLIVQNHGARAGPEHPVAGAVMLEGTYQANRNDRDAELLRDAKTAVLKWAQVAIASAHRFGKNDQA